VTLPALMFVAAAHLVAFVSPGRVERILDVLPATRILSRLFEASPYFVLAAVGVGLLLGFAPRREESPAEPSGGRPWTSARIGRLGARLILVPALGLLFLSAVGLVWINASRDSLTWLAERLPAETLLRLGLLFSPAMLLGLVLLAGLYLATPGRAEYASTSLPEVPPRSEAGSRALHDRGFRSGLALGVLVVGFGFTALAGMATLVAVVFVLAAR
jgi:hypothetical protein